MHVAPNGGKSFWLASDRHTLKIGSADSGGAFTLIETVARPEFGPPPHIHHRQDECFYIIEGAFEFSDDGRSFTAGAGSVVFLPRGRLHSHRAASGSRARALVLYTPGGLEAFVEEAGTPVNDPAVTPAPPALADLERIVAIAGKHGIEVPPPASESSR